MSDRNPRQRVAIVGLGCAFAQSPTPAALWDNVVAGRDGSSTVPAGRWPLPTGDVYDPQAGRLDKLYSLRGYFLDDLAPDGAGLRVDAGLLARLDPLFRLTVYAGQAAWRDAVTTPLDRGRVGVILGNICLPTEATSVLAGTVIGRTIAERVADQLGVSAEELYPVGGMERIEPLNRHVAGLPVGVLAAALGLRGGNFALDAACASSLYALKLAADELLAGRADAVLAGGVSRPDCLYTQLGFAQLRALAPDGSCRPFDAHGGGLVVGEGAGVLVLKRLDDALAHGDRIYGVLAGVGLSNDTRGNLLAPDGEGQLRALRAAYQQAGWRPGDVDLIECHATGTPVGDTVELQSLRRLWGESGWRPGQCVLGSVKSNVGHTLTAAGSAGLLKVLLAFRNEVLPPTANFSRPRDPEALTGGPFRVLTTAEPWQRRSPDEPRRAAVSAFGFGGINAHVLVEEWLPERRGQASVGVPAGATPADIAVAGLAASFGPWPDLAAFRDRVLGLPAAAQSPTSVAGRWWGVENSRWYVEAHGGEPPAGYLVDEVGVGLEEFAIPPRDLEEMLPQQLLMLRVAARALADAGWSAEHAERTGVFVGLALDLNTTNFHPRWLVGPQVREWDRRLELGLGETQLEEWATKLRDAAGPPLTAGRVLGALGSITASRIARAFGIGGPSFTLSSEQSSGLSALHAAANRLQLGELDYAVVGAVELPGDVRAMLTGAGDGGPVGEGAAAVVLRRADFDSGKVYAVLRELEWSRDGVAHPALGGQPGIAPTAVDVMTTVDDVGDTGAARGLADFVKAALLLDARVLPTGQHTDGPRYWLRDEADGPRRLSVECTAVDGNRHRVVLEEARAQDTPEPARPLGSLAEGLFVVEAADRASLRQSLAALRELAADSSQTVDTLARRWYQTHPQQPALPLACAVVARDRDELLALTDRVLASPELTAVGTLPPALAGRMYLTGETAAAAGKLAFVFPGSGNCYAGMGRELSAAWPGVFRRQERANRHLRGQYLPELFWDRPALDGCDDHRLLLQGQVAFGTAVTDLLRDFGLQPTAAIGYSLGESTALFALGAWTDRDGMLRRLRASDLFHTDLAGPCHAARATWGLPPGEPVDWLAGVVNRPAEAVRRALAGSRHAYLLIVNTPNECVVGGRRPAVEALVRGLGCGFVPLGGVSTVHCPVARSVAGAYRELHRLPVNPPAGVTFYSGATGAPYAVTTETAAEAITAQALDTLDFPGLVERAYRDGVRTFVEVGPGNSCTRMIGAILGDRPHVAHAACVAGVSEVSTVLRLLARLAAARVPLTPERLYGQPVEEVKAGARRVTLAVGRPAPELPPAPVQPRPRRPGPVVPPVPNGAPMPPAQPVSENPPHRNGHAAPQPVPANGDGDAFLHALVAGRAATAEAHGQYLRFARSARELLAAMAGSVMEEPQTAVAVPVEPAVEMHERNGQAEVAAPARPAVALDRPQCLEFAVGSIGKVLGPDFAEADSFPTRVRLPAEPLMLVDRVVSIEGEARSLTHGRVVTEHDIGPERWYLDNGRVPACIAIESGQADLFLSGYLGIDFRTRGLAVYRLLDAAVTFHRPLPGPGRTVRYDIYIDRFFRQGETYLFRFRFEGTVDGEPLLTMRDGCAGFFSPAELAAGKGLVDARSRPLPPAPPLEGPAPAGLPELRAEAYAAEQLDALRGGDLAGCFGGAFAGLPVERPLTLPGGQLRLIDRVVRTDPAGGRYGRGLLRAEQDIDPRAWFLTCHFIDDQVMPGTLMYECCLHAFRVYLLRLGWVGDADRVHFDPVPGVNTRLRCRGQVVAGTRTAAYEIHVKQVGFRPEPFAVADAIMYAEGKPIVEITDVSLQLSGSNRETLEGLWRGRRTKTSSPVAPVPPGTHEFDRAHVLEFATGLPSRAFGERYRAFDDRRRMARLPGPPYSFIDRVRTTAEPAHLVTGAAVEADYHVPPDAWYFAANRQPEMPFAVLLEIALQPCGWLAAYMGSALTSETDLRFRNLGGSATLHRPATADSGTLTTRVRATKLSNSAGMLIQHYDFAVSDRSGVVYEGNTYFGFFSDRALAQQVGVREAAPYRPTAAELARATPAPYPADVPFPDRLMRMVDRLDLVATDGGPHGFGLVLGGCTVDPGAWFFQAHFYQDPVWPGSLGLESLLQLLKAFAGQRFGAGPEVLFAAPVPGTRHEWVYRGQILPTNREVQVQAEITDVNEATRTVTADGWLSVDGLLIYQMKDFAVRVQ